MSLAANSVVGGVLVGGKEAYWRIADLLKPEDMPSPWLAQLYRICGEVAKSDCQLDALTVSDEAARQGVAEPEDVVGLAAQAWNISGLRGHAEIVRSEAMARRVKGICAEGVKTGDLATVQAQLAALLNAQPSTPVHASVALKAMWDDVMARYHAGDELTGIQTGIPLLDEWTGGLQPGRVYGVGARAKMGKSVLALNLCGHAAELGKHVTLWSQEMTREEVMQRLTCAQSGVPYQVLQRPKLLDSVEDAMARLHQATAVFSKSNLRVADATDVTIEQIESQARQAKACGELDVLCIDYLGLLRPPKVDRHDLAIGHITRRTKILAKDLRVPVILVFQINRGNEQGQTVRPPRPSDARDSGSIEQDLDAMILLHRPNYYNKAAAKGLRLELALQRNGQTGLIHMKDELHCCRFTGGHAEWSDVTPHANGRDDDL